MIKKLDLVLPPEVAYDNELLKIAAAKEASITVDETVYLRKLKRSIDARSRQVKINYQVELYVGEQPSSIVAFKKNYPNVTNSKKQAIIVGSGPAGLFAALRLIELGIKPIVLERGKEIQARRRDIAAINKQHIVDTESNYCFGEGGAGTYSDGKLYTRSKKRGDVRRILEILCAHGATEEILIDSHPHIGTNKLPKVVADMRQSILDAGGQIHFGSKVVDFNLQFGAMKGAVTADGTTHQGIGVILCSGHSARDIYELLAKKNIAIQAKPFALGVRVEHQQSLIDSIQYHCATRHPLLPASSYALVEQASYQEIERGVFSFCMCPGGFIVPSATNAEEIVVNGMSPSRRDSPYSNSGIVVAVELADLAAYQKHGVMACLEFQKEIEHNAWKAGGRTQTAPAQKLEDFVNRKISSSILPTSYQPGLASVNMDDVLPAAIAQRLRFGFKRFGQKMKGYLTNDAQIIGVESRTSSPILIPRDKETLEHIQIQRLYPCGEGAGYAGGIVSAAMDGERCAEQLAAKYLLS